MVDVTAVAVTMPCHCQEKCLIARKDQSKDVKTDGFADILYALVPGDVFVTRCRRPYRMRWICTMCHDIACLCFDIVHRDWRYSAEVCREEENVANISVLG